MDEKPIWSFAQGMWRVGRLYVSDEDLRKWLNENTYFLHSESVTETWLNTWHSAHTNPDGSRSTVDKAQQTKT